VRWCGRARERDRPVGPPCRHLCAREVKEPRRESPGGPKYGKLAQVSFFLSFFYFLFYFIFVFNFQI
jgi:hypothetical protein